MLFFPRDEKGEPLFPQERQGRDFLYDLAVRRGLPHPQALQWAREQAKARRGK